jgi:DNA polymerase (family 10)
MVKFREGIERLNVGLQAAKNMSDGDKTKRFKVSAYERAIGKLAEISRVKGEESEISEEDFTKMELTPYMKTKIITKPKVVSDKKRENPKMVLLNKLTNFIGIGEERAKKLIEEGLRNINQLHMKKWKEKLPKETQLFLDYKPEEKIPHEEISSMEPDIVSLKGDGINEVIITGSYRRKTPYSSDIDVMIVGEGDQIIDKFLTKLRGKFNVYPYSQGADKLSVLVKKLSGGQKYYKMDVFRVNEENKIPMLLYSTGSKENNIAMRSKAKKLNYLLNQEGLINRETGEKIQLASEEDYYKALDMPYKKPEERV